MINNIFMHYNIIKNNDSFVFNLLLILVK